MQASVLLKDRNCEYSDHKPDPFCFIKVKLKEAAESADDSDDLNDFIADFGEQCGIGSSGSSRERSEETCVTAIIPTPVRLELRLNNCLHIHF